MSGLMSLQVSLLPESLFTYSAGERPNVLVHPHVHCEVVSLCKHFPTYLSIFKLPPTRFVVNRLDPLGRQAAAGGGCAGHHRLNLAGLQHGLLLDDGKRSAGGVGDGVFCQDSCSSTYIAFNSDHLGT